MFHDLCSPLHVCAAAVEGRCANDEPDEPLIECRRCPVAYHEDCIPLNLMATRSRQFGKRVWLAKPARRRDTADGSEEGVGAGSDEEGVKSPLSTRGLWWNCKEV